MNKKICLLASSGGHIEELLQMKVLREKYDYFYVVPKTKWTTNLNGKKYFISDMNRKNSCTKIISLIFMFIQQIVIFLKERPDVIATTGAAVAIPFCIYAKIFRKKIIYIESIARVNTVSKTGKLIYKFADLFIVQWREQLKCYPKATYGGWIY